MITTITKKRIIRDFDKLEKSFQNQVLQSFPNGISRELITYLSIHGKNVAVIPFETDETYYLLRLPSIPLGENNQEQDYSEEFPSMGDYRNENDSQSFDDDTSMSGYDSEDEDY